jgi:hypothetical protein
VSPSGGRLFPFGTPGQNIAACFGTTGVTLWESSRPTGQRKQKEQFMSRFLHPQTLFALLMAALLVAVVGIANYNAQGKVAQVGADIRQGFSTVLWSVVGMALLLVLTTMFVFAPKKSTRSGASRSSQMPSGMGNSQLRT